MKMLRTAAMVLAPVLLLSACGGDPFSIADDFDDLGIPTFDLSESDDPAVRASSEAWEATVATQDAEDELAKGIVNEDLQAVRRAAALRPEDPRYPIFEDLLTSQQSLDDVCADPGLAGCAANPSVADTKKAAISNALELIKAQNPPGTSEDEIQRIWTEMRISAMREVIETNPDHPLQEVRVDIYCWNVRTFYPNTFSELFPATGAPYPCPAPPPEPPGPGGGTRAPGDRAEPNPDWEDAFDPTETEGGLGTAG